MKRFPIQDGPSVPWEYMVPYESQAVKNHSQSLVELFRRGGLGSSEAWCVVNGIGLSTVLWKGKGEEFKANWYALAEKINREWSEEIRVLTAEVKRLQGELDKARAACAEMLIFLRDLPEFFKDVRNALKSACDEEGKGTWYA